MNRERKILSLHYAPVVRLQAGERLAGRASPGEWIVVVVEELEEGGRIT